MEYAIILYSFSGESLNIDFVSSQTRHSAYSTKCFPRCWRIVVEGRDLDSEQLLVVSQVSPLVNGAYRVLTYALIKISDEDTNHRNQ